MPPSWGLAAQQWREGQWEPHIARPADHKRPKPKPPPRELDLKVPTSHIGTKDPEKRVVPITITCEWCGRTFETIRHGQRYCPNNRKCREDAHNARRRVGREGA